MTENRARIPHSLLPFICLPPEHGLYLITSVLGASSNWLLLRYLYAIFNQVRPYSEGDEELKHANKSQDAHIAVVLVSWMQEWEFWKTETRRATGLNLDQLKHKNLLAYIDGLNDLLLQDEQSATQYTPSKTPFGAESKPPSFTATSQNADANFERTAITQIQSRITQALSAIKEKHPNIRVVLILENPQLLLSTIPSITSEKLTQLLLRLRQNIHSMIIACPADDPFIRPAVHAVDTVYSSALPGPTPSPLETENAAFIMACVYEASKVLSCRCLSTGWAEDVSGVIRVTQGGAFTAASDGQDDQAQKVEEGEWLYHVEGDGAVKVWARGERV